MVFRKFLGYEMYTYPIAKFINLSYLPHK